MPPSSQRSTRRARRSAKAELPSRTSRDPRHPSEKAHLVTALVLELRDRNAVAVFSELPDDDSLVMFHRAASFAMRSMLHYRFVLLSTSTP